MSQGSLSWAWNKSVVLKRQSLRKLAAHLPDLISRLWWWRLVQLAVLRLGMFVGKLAAQCRQRSWLVGGRCLLTVRGGCWLPALATAVTVTTGDVECRAVLSTTLVVCGTAPRTGATWWAFVVSTRCCLAVSWALQYRSHVTSRTSASALHIDCERTTFHTQAIVPGLICACARAHLASSRRLTKKSSSDSPCCCLCCVSPRIRCLGLQRDAE